LRVNTAGDKVMGDRPTVIITTNLKNTVPYKEGIRVRHYPDDGLIPEHVEWIVFDRLRQIWIPLWPVKYYRYLDLGNPLQFTSFEGMFPAEEAL